MDMLPTMASLAGAKIPTKPDGIDIGVLLLEGEKLTERTLFWQHNELKAARQGKWKLVTQKDKVYLFDLERDLEEKNDLAEKEKDVADKLVRLLEAWRADVWEAVEQRS